MLIVVPEAADYFGQTLADAARMGALHLLLDRLCYLNTWGCEHHERTVFEKTKCFLRKDFAPHSFIFTLMRFNETADSYEHWKQGGLIYSGSGVPTNPLYQDSKSIQDEMRKTRELAHSWSIHT